MTMWGRFISCTKGAAAAEMALIVPLAMLMLFTSLEAGHYFYQRHQVEKGLRDGARYIARQSFDDINCRGGSASSVPAGIQTATKNLTRTGQISGGTPRIAQWADSDIVISVTCPVIAESQTGIFDATERAPTVSVGTVFKYDSLFGGIGVITDNFDLGGYQQATVMGI